MTKECIHTGLFKTRIDYVGQDISLKIIRRLIILGGIFGTIIGYFFQSYFITFVIISLAAGVAFVMAIPPWKKLRSNPIKLTPVGDDTIETGDLPTESCDS